MRTVDIHSDNENLNTLEYKIKMEISLSKKTKDKLLCFIVGYGSKGGSHRIKNNTIDILEGLKSKRQIKDYILGSDIDIFNEKYQKFIGKDNVPNELKNKKNPGIIIVSL